MTQPENDRLDLRDKRIQIQLSYLEMSGGLNGRTAKATTRGARAVVKKKKQDELSIKVDVWPKKHA